MNPKRLGIVKAWAVCRTSPDDGHVIIDGHFTNLADAERAARRVEGRAVPAGDIYIGDDGRHYQATLRHVHLDLPSREEVLARLSAAERRALGFD